MGPVFSESNYLLKIYLGSGSSLEIKLRFSNLPHFPPLLIVSLILKQGINFYKPVAHTIDFLTPDTLHDQMCIACLALSGM